VTGNFSGSLELWEMLGRTRVAAHEREVGIFSLSCSPDGRRLAVGDAAGLVTVRDSAKFGSLMSLEGHTGPVYGVAFTPDGRSLVSGGADGSVRVWDTATGRCRRTFKWHTRWVTGVAVAPDGLTAAASSEDGTVVVWDLDDD
jgi:WD40 repeat protein